jgi:manganese/zinc/iron transport system substrate-binding protein
LKTCSAVPRRLLLGLAAGAALPAGATSAQGGPATRGGSAPAAAAPRRAVATVAVAGDLLRELAGDALRTETLMGEGVDPHLYRPTRADIARLLSADAVFAIGHRLEGRMEDVFARLRSAGRTVLALAEALPRERLRTHPDYPDSADPHIWMDPLLWAEAGGPAAEAVIALAAPGAAEAVRGRLERWRARLARLDAYAREALGRIPPERRLLVTAHDAFGYFGARYGLELESLQGLSTDSEASLARVERLVALLVDRRVPAVFAEASVPDRAVRALIEGAAARGHQVALGATLYSDSMGRPGTYEGTHEGMLDHNITAIARALTAGAPGLALPPRGLNGRLAA